ncbi:MAG TPA: hypothetical protein VGL72_13140 [Bryobacteraceae bacterium]|jgi:tetratricopeptide (TPR) repeat protein
MSKLHLLGLLPILALSAVEPALDPSIASRIASAKQQIAKATNQPEGHTMLAMALLKAARATGRPEYLQQAEQSAAEARRIAPDNFEAGKTEVAIRLAGHRYSDALAQAKALNKKIPDDNLMYGYIADAEMALGDYQAAEKAVQWMIDQRPVNGPGLQRGARLREYLGYNGPALEWWNSALRITSSSDKEERAWILVNISHVELDTGKPANAQTYARQALELVPGYPWGEDALAAALVEGDKASEAVEVLKQRLAATPDTRARFHLAAALEAAGRIEEASNAWQEFKNEALARTSQPDNANCELIEYYATHGNPAAAVKLAAAEAASRHDIGALAAYAQALAADGQFQQARTQMERALAPGIRNARLFYQAGAIAARLNDTAAATKYLRQAIEINASAPEASKAIKLLASLT